MAKLGVGIIGVLVSMMVMLLVGIIVIQNVITAQETSPNRVLTLSPSAAYTTNATWSLTTEIQLPQGETTVKLNIVVTAITNTLAPAIKLTITGKDPAGGAVSETITLDDIATFTSVESYASVDASGLVLSGVNTGETVTLSITQIVWTPSANAIWETLKANIWVAFTLLVIVPIVIGAVAILGYLRFGGG